MDALTNWMIIRFTPYQTASLSKGMFSQKLRFKLSLKQKGYSAAFKYAPPNNSDDLCLLFCLYPRDTLPAHPFLLLGLLH